MPMIEKLKLAATGKNRSTEASESSDIRSHVRRKAMKSYESEDKYPQYQNQHHHHRHHHHQQQQHNEGYDSEPPPYDSIHADDPYTEPVISSAQNGPLPRRDNAGFTITQDIGEFPNRVPLNIRYDHPRLALADVAFQRQHQLHHHNVQQRQQLHQMPSQQQHQQHHRPQQSLIQRMQSTPVQQQQKQIHLQAQHQLQQQLNQHQVQQQQHQSVFGSPMNSRGVLSLGLPPQLMPNSIFRRTAAKPTPIATSGTATPPSATIQKPRAPQSATSDVIHHTYETLNSRRFYSNINHPQERCRTQQRMRNETYSNDSNANPTKLPQPHPTTATTTQARPQPQQRMSEQQVYMNGSVSNLTMLPPAQVRTRSQHPRGSSLPRKAKKIPSSSYNQTLLIRPKSVQDDLILNYPDPYHVTALEHTNDDLDSSLKTTDSGQTSGCSSGSSTVGSQSPKSSVDSDANNGSPHCDAVSTLIPTRRQSAFTSLPNRGPPPRHLVPATLRPSPAIKLHPSDVIINFQTKGRRSFD